MCKPGYKRLVSGMDIPGSGLSLVFCYGNRNTRGQMIVCVFSDETISYGNYSVADIDVM